MEGPLCWGLRPERQVAVDSSGVFDSLPSLCVFMYMYMSGGWRSTLGVFDTLSLGILLQSLSLAWSSPLRLSWLNGEIWISLSLSPQHCDARWHTHFFYGGSGF